MFSRPSEVCTTLTIIFLVCPMADVQIAMPMYPMMPPFPPPFGFGPPPMAMPMVMPPIAVPAVQPPETVTQKPKPKDPVNKPPCPPCFCFPCIPSFFSYCSPCHQKCRCKDSESAPEPLPASTTESQAPQQFNVAFPLPPPGFGMPPVVVIPVPPLPPVQMNNNRYKKKKKYAARKYPSSEEATRENYKINRFFTPWDTNETDNKKKYTKRTFRRMFYDNDNDDELIKPFLSFVSRDGDIRFKTKLSNIEAAKLLGERKPQESDVPDEDSDLEKVNKNENNIQVFKRKGKTAKVVVTL